MRRTIHATITQGEQSGYVAVCDELHAVTQGATLDETVANLQEAIALALEDEDAAAYFPQRDCSNVPRSD